MDDLIAGMHPCARVSGLASSRTAGISGICLVIFTSRSIPAQKGGDGRPVNATGSAVPGALARSFYHNTL